MSEPGGDILFVLHSRIAPDAQQLLSSRQALEDAGYRVSVLERDATATPLPALDRTRLVVSFGGDGTFLRAARLGVPAGIPLMGVNLGRLGFLAAVDVDAAPAALTAWTRGEASIESRGVMRAVIGDHSDIAINEAALLKEPRSNVIVVRVRVDGEAAGTFHADGAVVATPTGSTAYSLSAGGPLLDPRLAGLVLVPVNAHTLASRALVVPAPGRVEITVDEDTRVLLDGADHLQLGAGSTLVCSLDGPKMQLVRVPGSAGFYEQLRTRLEWGRPLVREHRRDETGSTTG